MEAQAMSVLFLLPKLGLASEVWMRRMMTGLRGDLAAVAANDTQGSHDLGDAVRAIALRPPARPIRLVSGGFRLLGFAFARGTPKEADILRRAIRRLRVTRVLCQYGSFAARFMNVWRETDIPLFVHFHGFDVFFDLRTPDHPDRKVHPEDYLARVKELEQRATLIAGSEFLKRQLVEAGVSSDRVVVKYYGVPVPDRKRLHARRGGVQILHLGRMVDFKSPDRTIKAFEIARSRGLDGQLVMVGDGPLKATCELLRLRSPWRDSIRLLDPICAEEAQRVYAESDVFTQHNVTGEITRQCEGFGVSPVEAMASGLPVVGTKSGGVTETVVDGETGVLVEPGDVEAQADAFLRLAGDPGLRQQMGDAGRARVSSLFSPQREAEQLRAIMGLPNRG
jgi:colanic acid/amylovoran biosynthesis glycosyltransferase